MEEIKVFSDSLVIFKFLVRFNRETTASRIIFLGDQGFLIRLTLNLKVSYN